MSHTEFVSCNIYDIRLVVGHDISEDEDDIPNIEAYQESGQGIIFC